MEPPAEKPHWLKVKAPDGQAVAGMHALVHGQKLVTVCEEAQCPNRGDCWRHGTATFMVCGDVCTRACGFCATRTAKPAPLDAGEPARVAAAVAELGLEHSVITMVTRDDLADGGAAHLAAVVRAIRSAAPNTVIEVLASDFNGNTAALECFLLSRPHIFAHNVETVERLTPLVRFRARYRRSLAMLRHAKDYAPGLLTTKSGLMLGLGEQEEEVARTMDDLLEAGVTVLTLGQYLRPTPRHLPVIRYLRPEEFDRLRELALHKGFEHVAAAPLIRSSHHAANFRPAPAVMAALAADLRRAPQEVPPPIQS